jgi:hypothetical protein
LVLTGDCKKDEPIKGRIAMRKFLTVVGLLTVIATPALAQGLSSGYGTGNNTPFAYGPDGKAHQVVTPNDQQQSAGRPLYNVVPDGQQHRLHGRSAGGSGGATQ